MRSFPLLLDHAAAPPCGSGNPPIRPEGRGHGAVPTESGSGSNRDGQDRCRELSSPWAPASFTSGPPGIYWRDADAVPGSFHTIATFTQTKAPTHPEAFGLFVAGKDLKGAGASYVYLIVRGDGMYSIRQGGAAGAKSTNLTTGGNANGGCRTRRGQADALRVKNTWNLRRCQD